MGVECEVPLVVLPNVLEEVLSHVRNKLLKLFFFRIFNRSARYVHCALLQYSAGCRFVCPELLYKLPKLFEIPVGLISN